jgi:hypothetical protein
MRHDVDAALDQCLAWLRGGMGIEDCLASYPEYAKQLRPLLELAAQVGRVITPASSAAARAAGEQRMLTAFAQRQERAAKTNPVIWYLQRIIRALTPGSPGHLRSVWNLAIVSLFILSIAVGALTVAASTHSLPGDALYPVKMIAQQTRLFLTRDSETHRQLEERFGAQQRRDVQSVLKAGRRVDVEFRGTLQRMAETLWVVDGLAVILQDATTILGRPYFGATIRVRGIAPGDGSLLATWLEVESEEMPVIPETVEPTATTAPTATPTATSTPAPTATPTPTSTPAPTSTPTPTATPTPTSTPAPTSTPTPTATPTPTSTPPPTSSPAPTTTPTPPSTNTPIPTAAPTDTPEPADDPKPTDRPPTATTVPANTPTATLAPSETSEPEETPAPTITLSPTESSEPEETPENDETPEPTEEPDD